MVSFNPNDEREGFCDWCKDWTGGLPPVDSVAQLFVLDDDDQPVPAADAAAAGAFLAESRCTVARDMLWCRGELMMLSTKFMAVRLGTRAGRPLWFETALFRGPTTVAELRYHTRERAARGHRLVAHLVRARRYSPKGDPT